MVLSNMEPGLQNLLSLLHTADENDRTLIAKAYAFAEKAHHGQVRESGGPYFDHLIETAKNLIRLGTDAQTVAAGLLHDTIEDTTTTAEDIQREFGDEILFLVEGVTKLGHLKYQGLKRHSDTLRKLFVATAADNRVILIKLSDRLHNLHTIGSLRRDKQIRIAEETLQIYAPIAHRLGIGQFKGELEDAAFKAADPEEYKKTLDLRELKQTETMQELEQFTGLVMKALSEAGIEVISIDSRLKHLYSLHKKLKNKNMNIENVYDIAAVRILVKSVEDCYLTLGIIHASWTPLPGRIKDYIAIPKTNGYQSLHTTVFTGHGAIVEVQIRTKDMHATAERGVASHTSYKEKATLQQAEQIDELRTLIDMPKVASRAWLKELAETEADTHGEAYIREIKNDLLHDRILVFTPKGEAIDLPAGATPIDFAYSIHTDLGDQASGARVNGKFVALSTELHHGDIVLIETTKGAKPSAKWLQWVKTNSARKKIRLALGMTEG
jgi:GTP pyrophosphokinase